MKFSTGKEYRVRYGVRVRIHGRKASAVDGSFLALGSTYGGPALFASVREAIEYADELASVIPKSGLKVVQVRVTYEW
ncbi:MAG: hypothetical protein JO317_03500 [Verrucomicrobiae bacterium]|nr:hypothetical protein [Verrucomicrobiae bacterium]